MKPVLLATLILILASTTAAQSPDPQLLSEIQKIKAIDNHSHPPRLVAPNEIDDEFDALPCDPLEPSDPPTANRPGNPQFLAAWKSLWGYKYDDKTEPHIRELLATKARIRQEQGDNYLNWVLDQLGIESELANRIALGRGLTPPHFRWVPFDDALLFPLSNNELAQASPDRKFFFSREDMLLADIKGCRRRRAPHVPRRLPQIRSHPRTRKAKAARRDSHQIRSRLSSLARLRARDSRRCLHNLREIRQRRPPPIADYTRLQDFLFRYVAAEAGRLNLPVHIHTGAGCGTYFNLYGSEPMRLESVFNDPSLRKTKFVMLHGGSGPSPAKSATY